MAPSICGLPAWVSAVRPGADPPPLKWSDLRYVFDIQEDCKARKRYKPEEIVAKLRQVDVLVSQGVLDRDAALGRSAAILDALSANFSNRLVTCHGGAIETSIDFERFLQ